MGFGSSRLQTESGFNIFQGNSLEFVSEKAQATPKRPSPNVTLPRFMERYPNAHGESGFLQYPFPNIVITDWFTPHGG